MKRGDTYTFKTRGGKTGYVTKEEFEINEAEGSFTIVANGIRDLKRADERFLEDTQFNIEALLAEEGIQLEQGDYMRNAVELFGDNSDMRAMQNFCRVRTKLAKDTVRMIKHLE